MPAISFSSDAFCLKILDGEKRQTIRNPRKHPIKTGDALHLFYRQRTSECMKLGIAKCSYVFNIWFDSYELCIDGDCRYTQSQMNDFAVADGFEDCYQLIEYFKVSEGKPLKGVLIKWEYPFFATPERAILSRSLLSRGDV
jgi:hypothetical protein